MELLALPGPRLFKYELEDGTRSNLDARKLNEYIRANLGEEFTAKVMRTVAERLGNTSAVARISYVSPAVVEQYLEGRRSTISGRVICVSFARGKAVSILKSRQP